MNMETCYACHDNCGTNAKNMCESCGTYRQPDHILRAVRKKKKEQKKIPKKPEKWVECSLCGYDSIKLNPGKYFPKYSSCVTCSNRTSILENRYTNIHDGVFLKIKYELDDDGEDNYPFFEIKDAIFQTQSYTLTLGLVCDIDQDDLKSDNTIDIYNKKLRHFYHISRRHFGVSVHWIISSAKVVRKNGESGPITL